MDTARSRISQASNYQNDTIEQSLIDWASTFQIGHPLSKFNQIYSGVALYEILSVIDSEIWPFAKLNITESQQLNYNKASASNFKLIVQGLERFYRERLEAIINHQTSYYDYENMVQNHDFNQLIDIVELVMGVVVNCEDKQEYIQQILMLEDRAQEDLQKLIEGQLNRLQLDFAEPSMQSDFIAPTERARNQVMENYEKEKITLRSQLIQLESQLESTQVVLNERDQQIQMLQSTIDQLYRERQIAQSEQSDKNLGGIIGGIKNLSELEAMLLFKEKEFEEFRIQMEQQIQDYKRQKEHLKAELEVQKEMTLNYQQTVIERDRYKQSGDENIKLRQKVAELELASQKTKIEIKNLEHELNEASTYKKAYEYMKDEIVKVKSEFHLQTLKTEKITSQYKDTEAKFKRIESKYDALKVKDRANKDLIETLQIKLRVYEKLRGEDGITGNGLGELDELEKQEIEKDVHEQLQMRLKEIEELKKENSILKISNLNELNQNILNLEQRIVDANAERDTYKAKVEMKEQRIRTLQTELDILRGQVEQEQEDKEVTHDINKENLRLKVEKDQIQVMLDKAIKKLEKKNQQFQELENNIKSLKDERNQLDDQIRSLTREKNDEKDAYIREKDQKIRLQTEKNELDNKISVLLKDNQTLEANLEEFKKKQGSGGLSSNEIEMNLKIHLLEKERDGLKWAQEKKDLENKINEYKELLKSKDLEYQMKERRESQKYKDELNSVEEDFREQIILLQNQLADKENILDGVKQKNQQRDLQTHKMNQLMNSQFYSIGQELMRSQTESKQKTWLKRNTKNAYSLNYTQFFGNQ